MEACIIVLAMDGGVYIIVLAMDGGMYIIVLAMDGGIYNCLSDGWRHI